MKQMPMTRHFKLVEALGTLLALGSLSLGWWSSDQLAVDQRNLRDRLDRIIEGFMTTGTLTNLRVEGAKTRAVLHGHDSDPSPGGPWPSSELAALTTRMLEHEWFAVSQIYETLETARAINRHLTLQPTLGNVRVLLERARTELPNAVEWGQTPPSEPPKQVLSVDEIQALEARLQEVRGIALDLCDVALRQLEERETTSARLYRALAILGGLMTAVAYLLEWRHGVSGLEAASPEQREHPAEEAKRLRRPNKRRRSGV